METFVHEDWVKNIDFESCETLKKSFVSDHYKETESDIVYKVKLKGKDVYIFILIEFQSTVHTFMALRILNYITNFYMDYIESHRGVKTLPAVFPIMLYNGDAKWTASANIADLIENNAILGKFSLNFEYFKIIENEYDKNELQKIRNIVSTLFLAESYYDIDLLKREFLELFHKEEDKEAVSLFLNWFKQLSEHKRIPQGDYENLRRVYKNEEEVNEMLIAALERERKKIYEKGIEKGVKKGIRKEKSEIAKIMLLENLDIFFISKVTGLSKEGILEIKSTLLN